MSVEQWFEKVTAYFNGTMSTEEVRLFETETAASNELSQLMQLWKTIDTEAILYEQNKQDATDFIKTHQKLKPDFIKDHADEFTTGPKENPARKPGFPVWKWVALAAALTGIIFFVKMLIPSTQTNMPVAEHKINSDSAKNIVATDKKRNPSPIARHHLQAETLYAQAFKPDNVPENPNGLLDDAFFYYASAQYKKAIWAIDRAGSKALTRGDNTFTPLTKFYAVYYKALSMMSLGEEAKAIPLLKQSVILSSPGIEKVKARWYLALAYIKLGKISSAVNTLQLLINNPLAGPYKKKAENLLEALNK